MHERARFVHKLRGGQNLPYLNRSDRGSRGDILKALLSVMVFAVAPFAIGAAGVLVAASVFGYSVRARLPDVLQLALLRNARRGTCASYDHSSPSRRPGAWA
jgi:hypothetical protein